MLAEDNYEGSPTKMLKVNLESRFWHGITRYRLLVPSDPSGQSRRKKQNESANLWAEVPRTDSPSATA